MFASTVSTTLGTSPEVVNNTQIKRQFIPADDVMILSGTLGKMFAMSKAAFPSLPIKFFCMSEHT